MKIDLSGLSKKELEKLLKDVQTALSGIEKQQIQDARKAAEAAAKKFGYSLNEIVTAAPKKAKAAVKAKYRNPDNAAQTWTGRGRQPAWYKAALAAGKSPDDMAI